jgi:uncharacterized membrane protein YhaH (DUF805 family)
MPPAPGPIRMQTLRYLFSPGGRLQPLPFVYGAASVYLVGAASHLLTVPDVIARGGLWPFIVVQLLLMWLWFVLHAQRLHDTDRSAGLAVGVGLLYVLSIVLLLIVADSFFNTSDGPMMNPSATSALGLILLLYVVATLLESTHYDFAWVVVAVLTLMAFVPIVVALGFTLWTATRPSVIKA